MVEVNQYDKMTKTPIPSLIIKMSIPTIISMLVTNIYNLADTAFVGQLGNSASGAVGIVFGFMAVIQALGFMFGQGSGSIVSRSLGEKDDERACRFASTAFFSSLLAGVILEIVTFLFMNPIVELLGSSPTIAPYAKKYITCILFATPFMISSFVLNNILRYEGKAALGMIGLLVGAIINIGADPLFMFVFDFGIMGAGIATAFSQCISFLILLWMFLCGKTQCKISIRRISGNPADLGNICATGLPSLLRQGLTSISTMLLNSYAVIYGDEAVAAMSIVSRVGMFVFSIGVGIGQGFQPVSGYNYGAKRYDRLREAFRFTFLLAQGLVVLIGAVVAFFAPELMKVFRNDPTVIEIGTRALRLTCYGLMTFPFSMATEMLLQSTGRRVEASILSSLKNGLVFIPVLVILANIRGLMGIQEAQPLTYAISLIPSLVFAWCFFRMLPIDNKNQSE